MIIAKVMLILVSTLLPLCLGGFFDEASALEVDISGDVPNTLEEGQVVNFTLFVPDFPQGYILSIDTDLAMHGDNPLFNITNKMNKEVYKDHFEINTSEVDRLTVHIIGEVPKVTEIEPCSGLTIKTYKKMTGHVYYRIELIDERGTVMDTDSETFDIKVPELEKFKKKLDKIDDDWQRNFLTDLHDEKGLVTEANELVDYLIKPKPKMIPLPWFIGSLIGIAFIFLVIGIRIGGREGEE